MTPISDFRDRPNDRTILIQEALETFQDIARLLQARTNDGELGAFYACLMAYCMLIREHLDRITKAGMSLTDELARSITVQLETILISETTTVSRLRELHARWDEVRSRDSLIKAQFIESALDFGELHDQRTTFINFLISWENEVRARFPEGRSVWTAEDLSPQKKVGDPSFSVWNAAEAMFKALAACQSCGCMPEHDFGARLCLGTYRKPHADTNDEGSVDFDMFLSVIKNWQEVRVHTVKKKAVQFTVEGQPPPRKHKVEATLVKQLCMPILRAQKMMTVELKVMQGRLFKLRSERSSRLVDLTKDPVSLEDILRGGPRAFTEKAKRILAVLLSYAVLHLHDTPWLLSTWSSSDILFFRTRASEIPLRPFLQTNLSGTDRDGLTLDEQTSKSGGWGEDQFEPDETDPDDLSPHLCPTIVALAIMLMEVHFVTPFDDLAERLNVGLVEGATCTARYLNAIEVFEACRDDIPENVQFLYAVEKCLDTNIWEDEYGVRLDSQALRSKLYDEVVRPLETDLSLAYSSISIDDLDQFAQSLDFSSWDQEIRGQKVQKKDPRTHSDPHGQTTSSLSGSESPLAENTPPIYWQHSTSTAPVANHHFGTYQQIYNCSEVPISPPRLVSQPSGEEAHKTLRFFDDATPPNGYSPKARDNYFLWRRKYQEVYEKFITPIISHTPFAQRVKIAVLDTGIDLNHPDIQACAENIKAKNNWLWEGARNSVHDLDGHGTFVTALLLDYAPDAEIYVAKIADKKPASPRVIAKAIYYAVNVWNVDMISMSFGFTTREVEGYDELEDAIRAAYFRDVLLFAAASNSGGQLGRAFPAREANVVCVHSTDTNGDRSGFSPTATLEEVNLATVGEAVESAWPMHLCTSNEHSMPGGGEVEEGSYSIFKSGTSYATPIMTGIAAFLLFYARMNLPDKAKLLKRQDRMTALLQRIAQKGPKGGLRDGYHFVDISLHNDSLFGKSKVYIDQIIVDLLS